MRRTHLWHFLGLVAFFALIFFGRHRAAGLSSLEALQTIPPNLYRWVPVLAAVAISVRGMTRRTSREALRFALGALVFMMALDFSAAILPTPQVPQMVLIDGVRTAVPAGDPTQQSWALVAVRGARGELEGYAERLDRYPVDHPRVQAIEALSDLGQLLELFATMGIALGIMRWLHGQFVDPERERIAQIVAIWLLAPIMNLSIARLTSRAMFNASFQGGSLRLVIYPSLFVCFVGLGVWRWAARDAAREDDLRRARP